jgi:hypothetical protein
MALPSTGAIHDGTMYKCASSLAEAQKVIEQQSG